MTQPPGKKQSLRSEPRVTLKTIAEHLGLTPGTVSAALNNSPAARSIPEHTKNRIIEEVWPVVEGLRRFDDAVLGVFRNGACRRRVIQRGGHCARSKTEVISNGFECDFWFGAKEQFLPR